MGTNTNHGKVLNGPRDRTNETNNVGLAVLLTTFLRVYETDIFVILRSVGLVGCRSIDYPGLKILVIKDKLEFW